MVMSAAREKGRRWEGRKEGVREENGDLKCSREAIIGKLGKERKKTAIALGRGNERTWCELQGIPMATLSIRLTKDNVSKGDQKKKY